MPVRALCPPVVGDSLLTSPLEFLTGTTLWPLDGVACSLTL